MNIQTMNAALNALREKYAVVAAGELVEDTSHAAGVRLKTKAATVTLLPWRVERRFIELKKMIDSQTLEDVSTLRFAAMSADQPLEQLLYRELDLCEFLGGSSIVRTFAVAAGAHVAHVVATLADDKSASIECSAALPAGTAAMDRHEIIARRGVGCDRVVDTQVPQSSIYVFSADGEERFTDTDAELFGFSEREILAIRAAFEVLKTEGLAEIWNRADTRLTRLVAETLASDQTHTPALFEEKI